jgi:hypothetical protein
MDERRSSGAFTKAFPRRDGRVAEGARLESVCTRKGTQGSNPCLSAIYLRSVNPGLNPANVMTMYLQLPETRYPEIPSQTNFRRELLRRINALPGVEAAMITDIPLSGNYVSHRVVIDGLPTPAVRTEPEVQTLAVMGDYFHLLRIIYRENMQQ